MHLCQTFVCAWDWVGRNSAAIIALAALMVSLWTVLTTRHNARMSALPLLHTFQKPNPELVRPLHAEHEPYVSVESFGDLVNGGLGPAIITKYQLFVDGSLMDLANKDQTGTALATAFGLKLEKIEVGWFSLLGGVAVLAKDHTERVFSLKFSVPTLPDMNRLPNGFDRVQLRVEYQSMYGDELIFDSESKQPAPPRLSLFRKLKRHAPPKSRDPE